MKKTIVFSFLFVFLCANTEIKQLLKLPNLIEHFLEHKNHRDENNTSLLEFIISHYHDNQKHSDTDKHDEHQNLPFKTTTSQNLIVAFQKQSTFIFKKPICIPSNYSVSFPNQFYTSDFFARIWLPPKLS